MSSITAPKAAAGVSRALTRRRDRLEARRFLAVHSALSRVQACGRRRIDASGPVVIKSAGGVAHVCNVQRCGSVWGCPWCRAKIMQERAEEIRRGMDEWLARGGSIYFVTMTSKNGRADVLADLWAATTDAWRRIWQGDSAMRMRADLGIVGNIRAFETTHGVNGWHPHLHVAVFTEGPLSVAQLDQFDAWLYERWCAGIQSHGFDRPRRTVRNGDGSITRVAVLIEQVTTSGVGDYLAKLAEADAPHLELARADLKTGRRGGQRSPWTVLADAMRTGDTADLAVWHEFERASKGKNAITWSPGLKKLLQVAEVSDEEIATREVGGVSAVAMPLAVWGALSAARHGVSMVLESVERDGSLATVVLLRSLGHVAWLPDPFPDEIPDAATV